MEKLIVTTPTPNCGNKIIDPDHYSFVVVQDLAERDRIPCKLRQDGMIASVVEEGYTQYQLQLGGVKDVCDNTAWNKLITNDGESDTGYIGKWPRV